MEELEITPLFLVLAGVIGLLIGLLIANIFSGRETRSQKTDQPSKEMQKEGFVKVAGLWYSPAGKKIITELDGAFYRSTETLTTDQKTRVLKTLELWQEWTKQGRIAQPEQPIEQSIPVMEPEPEENAPVRPIMPELKESDPIQPFTPEPDEQDFLRELQSSFVTDEEEGALPEPAEKKDLSIAEQISAIIDEMLEGNPLKEKGIKLIENQQNGVDVWVGVEKFSGIDEVPDPVVRDLIRNAVVRWEQENDPQRRV